MSQEKIEVIQRGRRALNEGDIEGIVEMAHPEIEIKLLGGFSDIVPGGSRFSGHAGVRSFFTDWFATFETVRLDHDKFMEAGEQIVTISKLKATVARSPAPVELLLELSGASKKERSSSTTAITNCVKPSKLWACRSRTLTPTPEAAGYCAGDVAGERRDRPAL